MFTLKKEMAISGRFILGVTKMGKINVVWNFNHFYLKYISEVFVHNFRLNTIPLY